MNNRIRMKHFHVVYVQLISDSQHSRVLLMNIAIETALCGCERNVYEDLRKTNSDVIKGIQFIIGQGAWRFPVLQVHSPYTNSYAYKGGLLNRCDFDAMVPMETFVELHFSSWFLCVDRFHAMLIRTYQVLAIGGTKLFPRKWTYFILIVLETHSPCFESNQVFVEMLLNDCFLVSSKESFHGEFWF